MSNDKIKEAFELSEKFLAHQTYQSLTHAIIHYFTSLEGVTQAASFEVFEDANSKNKFSVRRFPLTLDEDYRDANTEILFKFLSKSRGGIYTGSHNGSDWLFLDINKNVKPRRALLVEGKVSDEQMTILEGLFGVYANQVALLDSKERDVLTGLPNRQTLELTLNDIVVYHRSHRASDPAKKSWIAVLDIDHFKSVNDEYGHLYGDEVLVHFSRLMENTFRHTDFLFRYGGEEFVVILNNTDLDGARDTLERFRKSVELYSFPSGNITVSTGFTMVDPISPPTMHIEYADRAVYEAKNRGRNQTLYYDEIGNQSSHDDGGIEMF